MARADAVAQVRAAVGAQAPRPDDDPGVAGLLQRLCRAAVAALPADGVGVSVMSHGREAAMVISSSSRHTVVEELQFTLGEGPCLDAYEAGGPVLVPDLVRDAAARWPGYTAAAQGHGIRAVFAFPLQVGGARLGALDIYRTHVGSLSTEALNTGLTFAEAALETLLDPVGESHAPGGSPPAHEEIPERRLAVFQAQGMVMIQLGISLNEAMARLRAHAYAFDRPIGDVAADVVARRLVLEKDVDEDPPAR